MCDPNKFLTIQEVAQILRMNPEVVRRWLREGKIHGTKLGHDWRVPEDALKAVLKPEEVSELRATESGPKMCIKFPKWLEFSGLPKQLNDLLGPTAWPIFKKLIELDFEKGESEDRRIILNEANFCARVGYTSEHVVEVLRGLAAKKYITIDRKNSFPQWVEIHSPIKTPISIFDIAFSDGGIKKAPEKAFENRCLRRYVV